MNYMYQTVGEFKVYILLSIYHAIYFVMDTMRENVYIIYNFLTAELTQMSILEHVPLVYK